MTVNHVRLRSLGSLPRASTKFSEDGKKILPQTIYSYKVPRKELMLAGGLSNIP